ncbi:MAG: FdhF/YdeP family oxidoreductase [Acidimicrobiales bacterium]
MSSRNGSQKEKRFDPSLWVSLRPFGIGEGHPNNYKEITDAIGENRDHLLYAWRILNHGCCDGCSLGTTGMRDWTMDEIHLCNVRLRLLRLNTMPAMDSSLLEDVAMLSGKKSAALRELGRLSHPMVRHRGDAGFRRVTWDTALDIIAEKIRATPPDRLGIYMTSRGEPNENYYVIQKVARALGTNSIDSSARICHSPSTFGLKEAIGVAATTCSYSDWIGSDLVVFVGSNIAENQPVGMKYLYHAKKAGTKVAVVNPYREPAMERYWVPSNVESALFGTKITDYFFQLAIGGDVAFFNGVMKHMIGEDLFDHAFVDRFTEGFDELAAALDKQSFDDLERASGTGRDEMLEFARLLGDARTAVIVWSMGVTQHDTGEEAVRSIINLGLSKGFVGREKCGLMPVRGHSGVQGGAEMGAYATSFPGGRAIDEKNAKELSELWGFDVPSRKGLITSEMIEAAHDGKLDVFIASGGNMHEVLPEPGYVKEALARIPLRVHMDIVASSQMLIEPNDTVVLLPVQTRYEMEGGVTETSTERRVIFSPEIPGPRIEQARAEWDVYLDIARRARPDLADRLHFSGTAAIREDIARTIDSYALIRTLNKEGDQFQYGGPMLCAGWNFPTPDRKAHFNVVELPDEPTVPEGSFVVATRRGRQFNSMVQGERDPHTGAARDSVLMSRADAERLGIGDGEPVLLRSDVGEFAGHAFIAPMKTGMLEVHWPEGEVLIDRSRRAPKAGIPDYNAIVSLEVVSSTRVPA